MFKTKESFWIVLVQMTKWDSEPWQCQVLNQLSSKSFSLSASSAESSKVKDLRLVDLGVGAPEFGFLRNLKNHQINRHRFK